MSGQVLGIVPARLASTRLPQKPLYPLKLEGYQHRGQSILLIEFPQPR